MFIEEKLRERYAFALLVTRDPDTIDAYPDVVGTVEVNTWPESLDTLRERLRPWGLATLKTAGLPFGRYCAELVTLDEDGDPDRAFGREPIAWSGEAELVPADSDEVADAGHE